MKKMLSILMVLSLLYTCALGEQADEKNQAEQKVLFVAEEMAQILAELSTSSYVEMRTRDAEITERVHSWGNGLLTAGTPKRTAVIFIDKEHFSSISALINPFAPGMEDYPDILVRMLAKNFLDNLGSNQDILLFASSVVASFSEVRLLNDIRPGLSIVALDYGEDLPWVFVNFWIVEGGAAAISTTFIYADTAGELLMNKSFRSTLEDLLTYLQEHPVLDEESLEEYLLIYLQEHPELEKELESILDIIF